ncbi:dihydroorotate dehydrogenase electron transfer subunit [Chloroflexota bacterium]
MKQVVATVSSNSEVMPRTYLIVLESPEIAAIARPGQFIMVRCGDDTVLRRPLSIHHLNGNRIALLFAVVGKGTEWLSQCKAGENIDLLGPLGNGFSVSPDSRNLLLVAGGMGIAPLYFLAEKAKSQGYMVHFHEAVNTAGQLMLDVLSSHYVRVPYSDSGAPAAAMLYDRADAIASTASTADGSAGVRGLATICVPGLAGWADQIFACGPVGMYRAMSQMPELKNKPVQVSLEARMGCGHGICYGCTIKTERGLKQVCADGPVFYLDDILWDELN